MKKLKVFKGNRTLLLLINMFFLTFSLMAQKTITGKVMDGNGGEVIGASVLATGTTIGTITDIDGNFSIQMPTGINSIDVSYLGYQSQSIDVNEGSVFNIALNESSELLDEVIVIGYGQQKKSVVTGAVSSVNVAELTSRSVGQLESAIQGKTAGVIITPNSGAPDAGFKVKIRGTGSNGPSNPLYIIDGMRTRDVSWLESSAIQSLEILKDAASASIYGAEGANGVVLITTKNGSNGSGGIRYNTQYGTQSYRGNMDVMNSDQYLNFLNAADETTTYTGQGANTNWLDEIFTSAPVMRHNLSFSGGDDKLSYHFGGSLFDQSGILGGKDISNFKRISANIGLTSKVNDKLKVGANLTFANEKSRGSSIFGDQSVGGIISSAILMDPTTPVTYDAAGNQAAQDEYGANGVLSTDANGNVYGISQIIGGEVINPFVYLDQINGDGNNSNTFFASAYGTYDIIDNLSFTSRIGLETSNGTFHNWSPAYYYSPERLSASPTSVFNKFDGLSSQWENFLTYDMELGNNINLELLGGTSIYSQSSSFINAFGGGLVAGASEVSYLDGSESSTDVVGGKVDQKLQSYFGRASFNISDKYLVMASLRRDGTSLFTKENRYKTYPGVSLGWVISREDFFPSSSLMNYMKLRASWGQAGSLSGVTPGAGQPNIGFLYRYSDADGGFITVGESSELANPDLTWETGEQTNIGLDLGFAEDRVSFSMNYFNRLTKDLIATSSAPVFIGNKAPLINAGTMSNKGIELELSYRNRDNKLKYQFSANMTTLKNEVTEVNGGLGAIPASQNARVGTSWIPTVFEEGQPAWYFKGYEVSEVDASGEIQYVDHNEDGMTTEEDQVYIGDPHPTVLYGGIINLEYGDLDFTLFLQGQQGNDILVGYLREDRATQNRPTHFSDEAFGSPTLSVGNSLRSDKMIFDGGFTRIKQIQLGYNLGNLINGISSIRIYASLEDYFTFTSYKGLEPEIGSGFNDAIGIDRGIYPIPGRILFGASIQF